MANYPFFWPFITAFVMALIGFGFGLYMRSTTRRYEAQVKLDASKVEAAEKVIERLERLDSELAVLSMQVSPLWAAVQKKIAEDLTHPSVQFAEMDGLLRDLEDMTITDAQRVRLKLLLEERIRSTDPEVSEEERESAKLMIGVMAKVQKEAEAAPESLLPGIIVETQAAIKVLTVTEAEEESPSVP